MKPGKINRRKMLQISSIGTMASMAYWPQNVFANFSKTQDTLAIHGGNPIRQSAWDEWPIWNTNANTKILDMLKSGKWWLGNGGQVTDFEQKYASLLGAKRCQATASGTAALLVALHVLGIDAGDEVLVSPFTFIASYNVILMSKALPVFVDSDPETFLLDPKKIEERITDRTKAIVPVHIYGLPVDMDPVNAIAKKHNLKVIEDACQAWLAEYKNKKAGTLGDLGCFSFQNSKNLPTGEGGAITGNNEEIMDRCYAFHNSGRPHGTFKWEAPYPTRGSNRRMQQFQAIMLLSQMERIERDADLRLENALYLDSKLKEIPGIIPYKLVPGENRSAYHMYPFRYIKEEYNNIPKEKYVRALRAEGIPCSPGYGPQNTYGLIEEALNSRGYKRLFSEKRLKQYREENILPGNNQLCEEALTFYQSLLLGSKKDMDDIVNAMTKIYENRSTL